MALPPGATLVSSGAPQAPDANDPLRGASEATGMGADTRGPFRKAWDEIKRGLTAAQEGQGLKPQPTVLANAAEGVGMIGSTLSQFGAVPEAAAGGRVAQNLVEKVLPSTRAAKAGKVFEELKGAIGNHTVDMTDRLSNSMADIRDAVDTGSTLPSVINKFVTRVADIDEGPLTYKEARQFYSNVSDLSASEKMATKGRDLRLINEFKHALGETIGDTANKANMLQQYRQAMQDYAGAAKTKETLKTIGKVALATAGLGGAAGTVHTAYKTINDLAGK